jgi:hypothetical protein
MILIKINTTRGFVALRLASLLRFAMPAVQVGRKSVGVDDYAMIGIWC